MEAADQPLPPLILSGATALSDTPIAVSPNAGASLRNWGWIRELAPHHEVHLFTLLIDGQAAHLPAVQAQVASVTAVPQLHRTSLTRVRQLLSSTTPDLALRLWSPAVCDRLAAVLGGQPFDVVQVEGLELLPYAERFLGRAGPAWIYDAHNAEAALQASAWQADLRRPQRWVAAAYSLVQWGKLRRYERALLPRCAGVISVSAADGAALAALSGVRPLVVPNGIDTRQMAPGCAAPHPGMAGQAALVFTGKMDFRPNVDAVLWFAAEILPQIKAQRPDVHFWIVGQQPHPALARLQRHPDITITGAVPEIEPYLAGAAAVVVPLRMGSGTRLKVLQALSMARPVVGTPLGCAGLDLIDRVHLRLAESPAAFATAVCETLADPPGAAMMAQQGRRHVVARFDWGMLAPQLERFYQELAG